MREWKGVLSSREHLNEVVGVVRAGELIVEGIGEDVATRRIGTEGVHQLAIMRLELNLLGVLVRRRPC